MKTKIEYYFDQPSTLDQSIRNEIEKSEKIILYALADLNERFEIAKTWFVTTNKAIWIFGNEEKLRLEFSSLRRISDEEGITSNSLGLFVDDESPIKTVFYTNRQKVVFSQVKYYLEQMIAGNELKTTQNADKIYQQGTLKHLDKSQSGDKQGGKILFRLLSYLKPYKKQLAFGSLGAVSATILGLLPAYLTGRMIDEVIRPFQSGQLLQQMAQSAAWKLFALLVGAYVMREFFIWIRLKMMAIMGEKIARDLRGELFHHLQKLGMDYFSSKQTGSIISRVSSDTDRIWDFVAFGVVEVGISLIMLMGLCFMTIYLDWRLGLIMTLPVPFVIASIFLHGQKMQGLFLRAWRKWSDLTDVLSDTIPGIQVVKAFGGEKREVERFDNKNETAFETFTGIHAAWTRFWPLLMMSIHAIALTTWFVAIPRLLGSSDFPLSAGTFISFLLYMTMFAQPIEVIGQMARMLNRATSSAYRIFEVLDTVPTMDISRSNQKVDRFRGDIEFKHVFFSYDGVRQVIKGMNFKIKAGEMIGLVGPSGGGKSTITKLLSRFYDITSGQILIDGMSLDEIEMESLRKNIGLVLQDPYLFHGSVAGNIAYGKPGATMDEIIRAAKIANAHEFILKLPYGYDTVVGERGQTLSGGERQRVSIARAVLHDPKILILDEATSAVDTETERKIQDALDELVKGRTVIAIAHRLSTLRKADRILVIEDGTIKEQGTHGSLMDQSGLYFKLQEMQRTMAEMMPLGGN